MMMKSSCIALIGALLASIQAPYSHAALVGRGRTAGGQRVGVVVSGPVNQLSTSLLGDGVLLQPSLIGISGEPLTVDLAVTTPNEASVSEVQPVETRTESNSVPFQKAEVRGKVVATVSPAEGVPNSKRRASMPSAQPVLKVVDSSGQFRVIAGNRARVATNADLRRAYHNQALGGHGPAVAIAGANLSAARRPSGLMGITESNGAETVARDKLQETVNANQGLIEAIKGEFDKILSGVGAMRDGLIRSVLLGGHILLEAVPGTAKTHAAETLAATLGLEYSRIQGTPDLVPGDITGLVKYDPKKQEMEVRKGPVFTQLLLVDEINRLKPNVQSGLLQAMAEGKTTIDGVTYVLDPSFMVIATMNPIEQVGTEPLTEANKDRFHQLVRLMIPDGVALKNILQVMIARKGAAVDKILDQAKVEELHKIVSKIRISEEVEDYIVRLIAATNKEFEDTWATPEVRKYVKAGVSPRAMYMLLQVAQAQAFLEGRAFLTIEDVKKIAVETLAHRLDINFEGKAAGVTAVDVIKGLLDYVPTSQDGTAKQDLEEAEEPKDLIDGEDAPQKGLYAKMRTALAITAGTLFLATGLVWAGAGSNPEVVQAANPFKEFFEANPTASFMWYLLIQPFVLGLGLLTMIHLFYRSAGNFVMSRTRLVLGIVAFSIMAMFPMIGAEKLGLVPQMTEAGLETGWMFIPFHMLHAAGEEALMRGGLFLGLLLWMKSRLGEKAKALQFLFPAAVSSLAFALMHVPGAGFDPLNILFLSSMGMGYAYLYWKTRSLAVPIAAHILHNGINNASGLLPQLGINFAGFGAFAPMISSFASMGAVYAAFLAGLWIWGLFRRDFESTGAYFKQYIGRTLAHVGAWVNAAALISIPFISLRFASTALNAVVGDTPSAAAASGAYTWAWFSFGIIMAAGLGLAYLLGRVFMFGKGGIRNANRILDPMQDGDMPWPEVVEPEDAEPEGKPGVKMVWLENVLILPVLGGLGVAATVGINVFSVGTSLQWAPTVVALVIAGAVVVLQGYAFTKLIRRYRARWKWEKDETAKSEAPSRSKWEAGYFVLSDGGPPQFVVGLTPATAPEGAMLGAMRGDGTFVAGDQIPEEHRLGFDASATIPDTENGTAAFSFKGRVYVGELPDQLPETMVAGTIQGGRFVSSAK